MVGGKNVSGVETVKSDEAPVAQTSLPLPDGAHEESKTVESGRNKNNPPDSAATGPGANTLDVLMESEKSITDLKRFASHIHNTMIELQKTSINAVNISINEIMLIRLNKLIEIISINLNYLNKHEELTGSIITELVKRLGKELALSSVP